MAYRVEFKTRLNDIIAELDPDVDSVAVAHLRDAIEALDAVHGGRATKYALHDRLIEGQVVPPPKKRRLR